jgi:hypothetical protein
MKNSDWNHGDLNHGDTKARSNTKYFLRAPWCLRAFVVQKNVFVVQKWKMIQNNSDILQ